MSETDCRSAEGVAVALVDAIIAAARAFRRLEPGERTEAINDALADLRADEDVAYMLEEP